MRGLDSEEERWLRRATESGDVMPDFQDMIVIERLAARGLISVGPAPKPGFNRGTATATGLLLLRILDTERNLP